MKLAVIKTGGKQYLVKAGDKIKIEKLVGATLRGRPIVFDDILFNKKVEAKILSHGKHKKIIIFKYKAKKRYKKKAGHRQQFTEIQILKIYD